MPKRKLNNDGRMSGIKYAVIIATILTTVLAGGVLAKYIKDNTEKKNTVVAKEFYFTSNMLTEEGESYVLSAGEGDTASIAFTVGNNADELRFSKDDITYTVAMAEGTGKGLDLVRVKSDTLTGGHVNTISIEIENLEKGKTYTIVAIGKAGYVKTLKATFTVAGDDKAVYKTVTQNNHYVLLTVWTKNVKGTSEISLPKDLIPDNTDAVMNTVKNADTLFKDTASFKEAYSSHTYRFFKTTTKSYTANDFKVSLGGFSDFDSAGDNDVIVSTPE